jgi:hypothetical protein
MLFNGQGCTRDIEAGIAWLTRAAEQDDTGAQFNLATILSSDKDVPLDWEAAAKWYHRAAEKGHYPSQARLGFCYQQGNGVPQSRVDAYVWFALAAQHGVGTALTAVERIVNDMSAEEKRKGAGMVQSWRNKTAAVSRMAVIDPVSQ